MYLIHTLKDTHSQTQTQTRTHWGTCIIYGCYWSDDTDNGGRQRFFFFFCRLFLLLYLACLLRFFFVLYTSQKFIGNHRLFRKNLWFFLTGKKEWNIKWQQQKSHLFDRIIFETNFAFNDLSSIIHIHYTDTQISSLYLRKHIQICKFTHLHTHTHTYPKICCMSKYSYTRIIK